ncbi:hypothetical protein [Myxosarcina sp. GI1]|uniref:hypothetical protein n=1 Tax=Myxosarcina sp. GI1 TaxID=1541065 RepID=UPI00055C6CA0|nr:hypothetical protein [Myxosarcina sp. GI1]
MTGKRKGKLSFMNKYDTNGTKQTELQERSTIYLKFTTIACILASILANLAMIIIFVNQFNNSDKLLDINLKEELLKIQLEKQDKNAE